MKSLLSLNKILLLACASMYFGTGWSLVLFSFPIADQLTPENYYMQFVPQVHAATEFFTYMTMVMMACCVVFIIEKWKSKEKWYPIIVLLLVILATVLTVQFIFKYNDMMDAGIADQATLTDVLRKWMNLNIIRVSLWTLQWLTLAVFYFNTDLKQRINHA